MPSTSQSSKSSSKIRAQEANQRLNTENQRSAGFMEAEQAAAVTNIPDDDTAQWAMDKSEDRDIEQLEESTGHTRIRTPTETQTDRFPRLEPARYCAPHERPSSFLSSDRGDEILRESDIAVHFQDDHPGLHSRDVLRGPTRKRNQSVRGKLQTDTFGMAETLNAGEEEQGFHKNVMGRTQKHRF